MMKKKKKHVPLTFEEMMEKIEKVKILIAEALVMAEDIEKRFIKK